MKQWKLVWLWVIWWWVVLGCDRFEVGWCGVEVELTSVGQEGSLVFSPYLLHLYYLVEL